MFLWMGYVTLNMNYTFVSWARGLFTPADKIEIVFETSIPKYCMMTIFVLKNIIHTGNYWLLLGRYIWQHLYLSMGRIMALQQMIDKKNTFLFILLSLSVPPVWDKTFKIATNHLYLLSVADDRKLSK